MNKVLFSHSYLYKLDPKQWKSRQPYPPLGTLQAAAVTRQANFDTSFFDTGLTNNPLDIVEVLEKEKPDYLILYDDGFNYLTKMCLSVMREAAFVMTRAAKQKGCIVIVCNSDSADHYDTYLRHGVDYVIRGEGEETLVELLNAMQSGGDPSGITGIAFLKAGKTIITSPRPVLRNLDVLPLPAWDMLNIIPYKEIWKSRHSYFSMNVATTRGCPYKCNWCAKPIYGNRYNSRTPEHVIREIQMLQIQFQPDHIWMCDDIFGLKPGWIREFATLVRERGLSFRYKIQSRVDLLIQEDTVKFLAQSGCETVWLGAESGSQRILDAMDKGTTIEQIHQARRLLKENGIKAAFFLQFGYPGETKIDIDATLDMVLSLMPDDIGISVSYPLPGTKFYETVKVQLSNKQNWTDSDDLAMMYKSTFPPSYYKILQRYVHSRYRIQRGLNRLKDLSRSQIFIDGDFRKILSMLYHTPISLLHAYRLKQLGAHHAR